VGQHARGNKQPLGGLLLIVCGDFFQLPPVQTQTSISQHVSRPGAASGAADGGIQYCFQHPVWKLLFPCNQLNTVVLETVFRQQDDAFVAILERIRRGDRQDLPVLNQRHCGPLTTKEDNNAVLPTKIFTHKREVDSVNSRELEKCRGIGQISEGDVDQQSDTKVFNSTDSGDARYLQSHQSHFPVKSTIMLCTGAQVLLLKNIDVTGGLVNGARGVIVRFSKESSCPVVKFANGVTRTICKEHFTVQLGGRVVASRVQYPLDLCWAVSVHKSQGMTVDRTELHLRNVFEYGQAYVALSRVRTMEGLRLLTPLVAENIKAHPAVVRFYDEIESHRHSR
jgi:ATP-dependent DNA helicase PIF1